MCFDVLDGVVHWSYSDGGSDAGVCIENDGLEFQGRGWAYQMVC